jgi:glycosyltransferase involved in cell wall biosynthesis
MFELESDRLRRFIAARKETPRDDRCNIEKPRLSIVIPSLNQGRFLERTILSVLNQNYPNCELIIIDGGSTDSSIRTIKKYEKSISYWVSEKDEGQSDAINKGLRCVTGDFIGWQNADDVYSPLVFEEFARAYYENPGYDIYYGNRYYIDETDRILAAKYLSKTSLFYCKYRGMTLTNQTAFFSMNLIRRVGGMDVSLHFAMDNEFFLRSLLRGARAKHIPRFWGAIRHHRCSKTGSGNAKEWEKEHRYIRAKYRIPMGMRYVIHNKMAILVRLWGLLRQPRALAYHVKWHFEKTPADDQRSR